MARFRAYASDSSDDGSESESEKRSKYVSEREESESESDRESSSSSSSEMYEDELIASPIQRRQKPKRNALVEDEDGEIQYANEVDDDRRPTVRVSPVSSSSSTPPPPRAPRGDPTIIPWAHHVGVDPQKMHVMQTSLFRMPEEAAALKAMNQPRSNLRVPLQPLNRKHSRDSDGDGLRVEFRERASFAHDIDPAPYRPTRKYARVESSESAVHGKESCMIDAGLALGRSFRVGWGPGGTLVHLGSLCGPTSTPKTPANSSTITKTVISFFSHAADAPPATSKLLQHHLSNYPIEPDDDGIPFAAPSPLLNFSSFASLFSKTDKSYEASLFRLGHALFDEIDLGLGDSITVDIRNRVTSIRRRAALSAWLEDAVAPALEADLRLNPSASAATLAFAYLTGNQIEKAAAAAMDGGYLKLATLISQAGGDFYFQEDLKDQLQIWKDERIDVHVDEGVRKVYTLLAGIVDGVVEGSKGGGLEKCSDVDVTKDLDWKRVFGLHLWFSEPVDPSIAQVFHSYDQLVKNGSQRLIARPVPWYAEQASSSRTSPSSRWKLPSPIPSPDGLFSLIRLHAEPACSLSQILAPLSFCSSPVDYSLAWHLYIILSRCMGVRDFADRGDPEGRSRGRMDDSDVDDGVEGHSPSADLLASSYALQLEGLGMLQEAVFVLLHIEGTVGREKAIKDLLGRSAPKLDEWMTRGIVGSLKIPMAWVNEAKAVYALDKGDVFEAYELFLFAGLYNPAHDLAVLELAPDAVVRRDLELLKEIFSRFIGRPVDNWHVRGKAFLDYAHIMTRLPELIEEQWDNAVPDASQDTEIDELARSVPKLIGILPDVLRNTWDPRHPAALSVMIAGLVAQVDKVRPLALSQVQPTLVDETMKLQHIHSMAHARFLKSIY